MSSSIGITPAEAVALAVEGIPPGPPPAATCSSTVQHAPKGAVTIE